MVVVTLALVPLKYLRQCNNNYKAKIQEALLINKRKHTLYVNSSSFVLKAFFIMAGLLQWYLFCS